MTRTLILALAAAAALAGCNNKDHTIVAGGPEPDNDTNAVSNGPVELPPSIVASKTYRCADNRLVYVDWLSDNKSANLRSDKASPPIQLVAAGAGKPLTAAGGYALSGTSAGSSVKIATPGHPEQSCKA